MTTENLCIAFNGPTRVAAGPRIDVALAVKQAIDRDETAQILVFDTATSRPVEFDLRGTLDEVRKRLIDAADGARPVTPGPEAAPPDTASPEADERPKRPGRPKLGVVGREVTLLPRHWAWLNGQPGGASVALRKLVEKARQASDRTDRQRVGRDSCYRFMSAMAGNLPNFEEASRALFAGDRDKFDEMVDFWPGDIREHAHTLAEKAF
ncbi:DUF2239 family protein [Microbaculum sp. FT89]|uniref:DUF2239 family protein n=1 Tax=Microbaculum sp. FT89 TaxID=3447298 RepID=UPI003F52BCA4